MSRIKIEISGKLLTRLALPVRITDINYGNHTGNDALVGLLHEARVQWLHQHNYTELNIDGLGLIMSDLAIEFKNESFYGDVLDIELFCDDITLKSFDLLYRVTAVNDNDTILIAKAKTGMVCFDYAVKKIARFPDTFMSLLKGEI